MASRAERKQEARERRLAQERAAAGAARRRRRLGVLGAVVAIAVVVVVVAIVVSASDGAGARDGARGGQVVAAVDAELHGIPEHGETLGDPHARVTLSFFGDLQCPICAGFATGATLGGVTGGLPRFIADQVRSGRAKVVYHSLCTATCADFGSRGPALFDEQQTAAEAAGRQNRFWYYEQLFYREQGAEGSPYVTPGFLTGLARQTSGLDLARWRTARGNASLSARVRADAALATRRLPVVDGGRGTPGLIMSGPRGSRFVSEGIVAVGTLDSALRAVS